VRDDDLPLEFGLDQIVERRGGLIAVCLVFVATQRADVNADPGRRRIRVEHQLGINEVVLRGGLVRL